MYSLEQIADMLDSVPRVGAAEDAPEGNRWVEISDTLAKQLSQSIRWHARGEPPNSVSLNRR